MTRYRERHLAGLTTAPTANAAPASPELETDDAPTATLAELKEQADALGLATYGTKAQLQQRIDEAS